MVKMPQRMNLMGKSSHITVRAIAGYETSIELLIAQ